MITSKVNLGEKVENFPLLAENKTSKFIILFTNEKSGIVLNKTDHYYIGHFSEDWASCFDSKIWRIFSKSESITLTQE